MPTREIVESAIAAIENNGNNTAAEVRTVLNLLLEHGEENPKGRDGGSGFETFDVTQSDLTAEENRNATLGFSFRGFRKFHGNLTFNLKFGKSESRESEFNFKISDEVAEIFAELGIHNGNPSLAFVVPMFFSELGGVFPSILHIGSKKDNHVWLEVTHNIDNFGGEISASSSIHFHLPVNARDF